MLENINIHKHTHIMHYWAYSNRTQYSNEGSIQVNGYTYVLLIWNIIMIFMAKYTPPRFADIKMEPTAI